jgi:hypothetical protein
MSSMFVKFDYAVVYCRSWLLFRGNGFSVSGSESPVQR